MKVKLPKIKSQVIHHNDLNDGEKGKLNTSSQLFQMPTWGANTNSNVWRKSKFKDGRKKGSSFIEILD